MVLTIVIALVAVLIAAGAPATSSGAPDEPQVAAAAQPPTTIPAIGSRWFALGTTLPYLRRGCDFGCGAGGGITGRADQADRLLRTMSRSGISVVRWELFSGDAWQIQRDAAGTPTSIVPAALRDLDLLLRLAAKHDVFVVPVVLPDPAQVPPTWFTDPAHHTALATVLTTAFARYKSTRSLLGWELVTGADSLLDGGTATLDGVRAHGQALMAALNTAAPQLGIARPSSAARIDAWVGLGFDAYAPPGADGTAASLVGSEGVDAPVIIGTVPTPSAEATTASLRSAATRGYAGAFLQSWTGQPGSVARPQPVAVRNFAFDTLRAGPRSRPRNPCLGPDAGLYRCPNLQMSVPRDVSLGRRNGRAVLFSTNSLNSYGSGPASIRGVRTGKFTMAASQLLHRKRGVPATIRTGAKLAFKAIPGQYRYWKWDGAAQMELWRLDSTGAPVQLARTGPKTVYCLRDLRRTRGLPRSPRGMVYPACNQSLKTRQVTLGTSVGWSDIYPASYYENWIDIAGLRGCFAYVHIADPTNVIYESNEDDNRSSVVVKLPYKGTNRGCPKAKPLPVSGQNGLGY